MSSRSTAGDVLVPPEAAIAAWEALRARNPDEGAPIGVSHVHPGCYKPVMSSTDNDWHRVCLDLYSGAVVDISRVEGEEEAKSPHQVFYQLIFPQDGSFDSATAYLIARRLADPLSEQRHFEIVIRHEYPEAELARARLASFAPRLGRDFCWGPVSVTFGGPSCTGSEISPGLGE